MMNIVRRTLAAMGVLCLALVAVSSLVYAQAPAEAQDGHDAGSKAAMTEHTDAMASEKGEASMSMDRMDMDHMDMEMDAEDLLTPREMVIDLLGAYPGVTWAEMAWEDSGVYSELWMMMEMPDDMAMGMGMGMDGMGHMGHMGMGKGRRSGGGHGHMGMGMKDTDMSMDHMGMDGMGHMGMGKGRRSGDGHGHMGMKDADMDADHMGMDMQDADMSMDHMDMDMDGMDMEMEGILTPGEMMALLDAYPGVTWVDMAWKDSGMHAELEMLTDDPELYDDEQWQEGRKGRYRDEYAFEDEYAFHGEHQGEFAPYPQHPFIRIMRGLFNMMREFFWGPGCPPWQCGWN